MKLTNVYRQPSVSSHVHRFEFTNIKPIYSSFVLFSNNQLYTSTSHNFANYPFFTKVIPYENIAD